MFETCFVGAGILDAGGGCLTYHLVGHFGLKLCLHDVSANNPPLNALSVTRRALLGCASAQAGVDLAPRQEGLFLSGF